MAAKGVVKFLKERLKKAQHKKQRGESEKKVGDESNYPADSKAGQNKINKADQEISQIKQEAKKAGVEKEVFPPELPPRGPRPGLIKSLREKYGIKKGGIVRRKSSGVAKRGFGREIK
jgi:DNA repair ATPase RecN